MRFLGPNVPNRTICNVLEEMRSCYKTRNFAHLGGLIEEAQSMANRMEAALWDVHDLERVRDEYKELKREVDKLEAEKRES